jgi:hypothetical protein
MLEESMMENPELYNNYVDYDFWMQCRKEELLQKEQELLERADKPPIKLIRKRKLIKCQTKKK